ncbi:MAG: hypothetical protein ACR2PA_23075 [Hyphomicrobiaceae bacterium]
MVQRSKNSQLLTCVSGYVPAIALLAAMFAAMFWLLPGQNAAIELQIAKEQQYQQQIKSLTVALKDAQAQLVRERSFGEGLQQELRDVTRQIEMLSRSLQHAAIVRQPENQFGGHREERSASVQMTGSLVPANTVASIPLTAAKMPAVSASRYAPRRSRKRGIVRTKPASKSAPRPRLRRTAALAETARPISGSLTKRPLGASLPTTQARPVVGLGVPWPISALSPSANPPVSIRQPSRVRARPTSRRRISRRVVRSRRATGRAVRRARQAKIRSRRPQRQSLYARLVRRGVFGDSVNH